MANRDGRISSRWVWPLLILASTASAFSLSNFQVISSTSVPLGCILAYNSPIPGCSMNDFVKGRVCSAACVRGLTRVQLTLQSACYDVNADAATVLGQVLLGNLVALVCPVRSTSTSAAETTETEEPDTSTSDSSSSPTATSSTAVPTFQQSSSPTSTSSSLSSTATTAGSPEPTPGDSSGGGSPFDVASSGSIKVASSFTAMAAALGFAILLVH